MARPEMFQMPLLLGLGGRPVEDSISASQGVLRDLPSGHDGGGRLVRAVSEEVIIRSASDVAKHLMRRIYTPLERLDQEELWTLLLNNHNRLTHEVLVHRGALHIAYVRLGALFREAVRANAASIILAHCHPSGDPTPSIQDLNITEGCLEMAKLLDISLLDHLVIGNGRYVSMKESKLGFKDS